MNSILLYSIIFVIKVLEVSLATLRIVLITKDERLKGAIIGFFEVIIWVIVVSAVLTNITEDPFKVVVYALGFAVGNYVGSKLENILAIGNSSIEAICHKRDGKSIVSRLRDHGFAVTVVNAKGMMDKREILTLHVPRKRVPSTVGLIRSIQDDVVITIHDIKPIHGGHRLHRK